MTKHKSLFKRAIFLMAFFIFLGCEKPNEGLGFDTLIGDVPNAERVEYGIKTGVVKQDSILVAINYDAQLLLAGGYAQAKLLGTYVDPLFGLNKAEFISEVLLEDLNPQFSEDAIVDSVNLYLRTTDYYGDTNQTMRLEVHQLAEELSRDTSFYSSFAPGLGAKLGELTAFSPRPNTSLTVNEESTLPSFKIPLDVNFFQENFADQGSNFDAFTTNEDFRTYFKGIKISVEAGEGAILTINSNSVYSQILIFYRQADSLEESSQLELNFAQDKSTKPIGFSTFQQDYISYPVAFDENDENTTEVYTQSTGGVFGTIQLEMVDTLMDKGYAINRAYLELPIKPGSAAGFRPHSALELREIDEEGEIGSLIDDFARGQGGGSLLSGTLRDNKYRLEFTRTLFRLLNNTEPGETIPSFALVPVSKSTSPRRSVLNGGSNTFETPKLIVFYTKSN
jgi:hypothetical protein